MSGHMVASYLGFGTLCGSLGAQCFILVPRFPSKSGLKHKHIVKTCHCSELSEEVLPVVDLG
jgi:hypothetical protein